MENKLDKIEEKVDKIGEQLGAIDKTLTAQHVVLKEHIRRTEILEADIAPLKKHVTMIEGALKFIGFVCVVAGAAAAIIEVLDFLKG